MSGERDAEGGRDLIKEPVLAKKERENDTSAAGRFRGLRETVSGLLETFREFGRGLWGQLLHKLPLKLGALLLATIFWFFVSTDDALLAQRTLRAPLHTEGLSETQIVAGLPDRVTVRLSGSSNRLSALNPDGLDVVLNLRGVTGEFERDVRVFPPQGITVVRVIPNEIIGSVETLIKKEVPVQVVTLGTPTADTVLETRADPAVVQVEGTEGQLERVTQVLAPYSSTADTEAATTSAELYAADAAGEPVAGVTITPTQVSVNAAPRAVLSTRTVPLELSPVTIAGLEVVSAKPTQADVTVVGPEDVLRELSAVTATLQGTSALGPGRYTLGLTLALPDGVAALDAPQLELRVRATR